MNITDQAARDRAWQCFDRSLDVRAGAGTGKTRVLVDRYLAWVLGEAWRTLDRPSASRAIGSVLAITFTEKAAGEMQERIAQSLRAILGQEPDEYVQKLIPRMCAHFEITEATLSTRAEQVLERAHRMEVSTIHAFGVRVLRRWALDAGLHPDLRVDVEGRLRRKALRRAFVDQTHAGLLSEDGAPWAQLVSALGEDGILDLMVALLDAGYDGEPLAGAPDFPTGGIDCRDIANALTTALPRIKGASKKKADRIRQNLGVATRVLGRPELVKDPRGTLHEDERKALATLEKDLAKFPPKTVAAALVRPDLTTAAIERVRPMLGELLRADAHTIGQVVARYGEEIVRIRKELRLEGLLSFDDLLVLVDQLLQREQQAARSLAEQYRWIFVDEFQDTDPQQCRILNSIANQAAAPCLFVVGDPKQSIYSFRGADLSAYENFTRDLDERLELRSSFRSQERLVEATNRAFDALFVAQPGRQPAAQALAPTRAAVPGPAVHVWDAAPATGGRINADEARRMEAEAIRRAILTIDAREPTEPGARWSRFAVLSRVQSEAAVLVDALEEARIPCIVTGDKEFYRRQEVLDAVNLLRVLLDPADSVAMVGLLRSPIGGVPDRVLLDLARAGFFQALDTHAALAAAEHDAPPERARHLRRLAVLCRTLSGLRESLFDGPIDLWLEELRERLPLPELYATQYLGERKAANLLRVFEGFGEAAREGTVPLSEWLDTAAQNLVGRHDEAESALADETTDAVRVMSIHASKGLQFEHVFVPRLDWRRGGMDLESARATRTDAGWVVGARGRTGWGTAALKAEEAAAEEAETLRLLYVACTRARESLVLLGRPTGSGMAGLVDRGFKEQATWSDAVALGTCEAVHRDAPSLPAEPDGQQQAAALIAAAPRRWRRAETYRAQAVDRDTQPVSTEEEESHREPMPGVQDAVDLQLEETAQVERTEAEIEAAEAARSLGIEVHRILELWTPGQPADLSGATEEAAQMVRSFLASPLAVRVRDAKQVLKELPWVGPHGVGVIDLLLQTRDGWLVVDYKTNVVRSEAAARRVAQRYREQADAYVRAVREALATDAVRCELWFLRGPWAIPCE